MMQKICLVTCGDLPVPAVQGGAVETLLQLLAEENERQARCSLVIISRFCDKAVEESRAYKRTTFLYVRADSDFERKLHLMSRAVNKLFKMIFRTEIPVYSAWYRRACSLAAGCKPDFVVCEGGPVPAAFAVFRKFFPQDRTVIHLHGNCFPSPFVSQLFGRVISVSGFVQAEYLSVCTNKNVRSFVVFNTVNQSAFRSDISADERRDIRAKYGFSGNDFVVVFCGRICKDKGVHELEKAVLGAGSNVKLLIIGSSQYADGTTTPYLKEAMRLGQMGAGRIVFTGFVRNSEVHRLYKACDCMALPSLWEEPCALVQIEGMTAGLPLVCTRSGGIPEYVSDECAVIIERGARLVPDMTETFNMLARSPERCLAMKSAGLARSGQFSVERFYASFLECFS